MKKSDIFAAFILALIISFSFLSFQTQNNKAYGQAASSSSSSGSSTTSSSSSGSTTSSSSGSTTSSSSSGDISSSSSGSSTTSSSSGSSTSTSSSGSTANTLNQNFTGVWKAELPRPPKAASSSSGGNIEAQVTSSSSGGKDEHHGEGPRGSRIITFKLCVKDGSLVGSTVQQGGILNMGVITSQTIISSDEVSVNIEGDKGAKATIDLKLTSEREFAGTFADGHTFKARKLNPFKSCLAPGHNKGEDHGPNGEPAMGSMGASSSSGSEGMSGPGPEGMSGMIGGPEGMSGPGPEGMSGMIGGRPSMGDNSSGSPSDNSGNGDLLPPERMNGHGGHHSGNSHGHGMSGNSHGHGMSGHGM